MLMATLMVLTAAIPTRGEYVVSEEGLRLRAGPSLEAEILDVLPFSAQVTGTISDGWMRTEDGYLKAEYLSDTDPLAEYEYLGNWLTTAYTHTGQNCFNGEYPEENYTIASNSLEIGTEVFIAGIGFRTVEDRGPTYMPTEWLDIFMDEHEQCVLYGTQYHDVWVIKMP